MKISKENFSIIKLIFLNFSIFLVLFFILDFIAFYTTLTNENKYLILKKKHTHIYKQYFFSFKILDEKNLYIYNKYFHSVKNKNSKKGPILLFGCSYANGRSLGNNNFSSLLSKATQRPIYDRSFSGWGIQHMLYQLKNDDFYNIVPKPEYIIYVFIPSHIKRLYLSSALKTNKYYALLYKIDKKTLKRDYFNGFINQSTIIYLIRKKIFDLKHNKDYTTKSDLELLKHHFLEAKKTANTHWGNDTKFVIFLYVPKKPLENIKPVFDYLEHQGFIIININNINNINFFTKEYQIGNKRHTYTKYDKHPNVKAWKTITPYIVKKLNL